MIDLDQLAETVDAYLDRYREETHRLAPLLAGLASGAAITSRDTASGHATCSAFLINPAREVLHVRHRALDRWLQPGGHLEPTDSTLLDAALREVAEETGVPPTALRVLDALPLDIDVHVIPANPGRGEPAHHHFDLRYAFAAPALVELVLQPDEVSGFRWLPVDQMPAGPARDKLRMVPGLRSAPAPRGLAPSPG